MQTPDPMAIFQDRLRRVHRRTLWRVGGFGAARLLGVGGSMVVATLWMLGVADRPGRFLTYGLLVSLAVALVALLWTQLLGRLWRLRRPQQLVHLLERRGYFANLLVAAEEAVRDPSRWDQNQPVTRELRARLLKRAGDRLLNVGPADAAPLNRRGQTALGVALCLLLATLLATAPGDTLLTGWQRFLDPTLLWAPPPTGGAAGRAGPRPCGFRRDPGLAGPGRHATGGRCRLRNPCGQRHVAAPCPPGAEAWRRPVLRCARPCASGGPR